jgi:hypothetical protein
MARAPALGRCLPSLGIGNEVDADLALSDDVRDD